MKQSRPLLRRTPLRPMSDKRRREREIYLKKRAAFLKLHPVCCVVLDGRKCKARATDIHHKFGRVGANYLDENTWLATCRPHHQFIHQNPKEAREVGLLA